MRIPERLWVVYEDGLILATMFSQQSAYRLVADRKRHFRNKRYDVVHYERAEPA